MLVRIRIYVSQQRYGQRSGILGPDRIDLVILDPDLHWEQCGYDSLQRVKNKIIGVGIFLLHYRYVTEI